MTYTKVQTENDAVKCDYCGLVLLGGSREAGAANWDWIRGYHPFVKHACPKCQEKAEWKRWVESALIKPSQEVV